MDIKLLASLGLTKPQARAYIALTRYGALAPPDLASKLKVTRTNAYKILAQLAELGLASRDKSSKKALYRVNNPVALEKLAKKTRDGALAHEKQVSDAMPSLLNYFYTYSEQPGVRFFVGKDGIKEIFEDMLRTRQPVLLLRSPDDNKFYDEAFFADFQRRRARLRVETSVLSAKNADSLAHAASDRALLKTRRWLAPGSYTASVEWDIYANKVALISYGQEAIGMIIESPQVAASFRQVFELIKLSSSAST
jgi:sugar-specific transcriptional regulator TrmB